MRIYWGLSPLYRFFSGNRQFPARAAGKQASIARWRAVGERKREKREICRPCRENAKFGRFSRDGGGGGFRPGEKKTAPVTRAPCCGQKKAGSVLLSHLSAVSSAKGCLTSVFGTGTGISTSLWPPAFINCVSAGAYGARRSSKILEEGILSNENDNMAKPHDLLVLLG